MEYLTKHVTEFFQIENEYENIENSYGKGRKKYMKWASKMALSLGARVHGHV